jgi:hypothetical protein
MTARNQRLWALHDFATGRGLEIGPLAAAIATRQQADVRYADVFGRDRLVEHYEGHPINLDLIPEIDYPLWDGERMRTLAEAAKPGVPFDWIAASHVIEHIPDVIGWLQQIAEMTTDEGTLVLAVPDRRYCFDSHRPPTTVGQMLQAFDARDLTPSVRAVYDYFRTTVDMAPQRYWKGEFPTYDRRIHSLELTLEKVAEARAGNYVDAHVWMWTPDSFVETIDELRLLGLCPWRVERLAPTERNELEFLAVLRRVPIDTTAAFTRDSLRETPDWLQRDELERLRAERTELEQRLRAELKVQRRQNRRLQRQIAKKDQELADIRSSRRWRAGGIVAAPVSALRRVRRSR